MKWIFSFSALSLLAACQPAKQEFNGREASYALTPGSAHAISGSVDFKEKPDGVTEVKITLKGTDGRQKLPVHLHFGDVSTTGAPVALLLSPVDAQTGISVTRVTRLADDTEIDFEKLLKLAACVKIHLSDAGEESNIILAAGNIGANGSRMKPGAEISLCQSK